MRRLLIFSILWVAVFSLQKPDLYVWLEQNSYICDQSLSGNAPRFLTPDESKKFKCECGDPLISHSACSRNGEELPACTEIPDLCMREYIILFTETSDRLSQPLTTRASTTTTTAAPTTTTATTTTSRRPSTSFRPLQQRQNPSRRPSSREFVFRTRLPGLRSTRRSFKKQMFTLQNRFPFTRRPSIRTRERARPLPRLLPSSRFRSTFREFPSRRRPSTAAFIRTTRSTTLEAMTTPEVTTQEITSTPESTTTTLSTTTTTTEKPTTTMTPLPSTTTTTTTPTTTTTRTSPTTTTTTISTTTATTTTTTTPKPTTTPEPTTTTTAAQSTTKKPTTTMVTTTPHTSPHTSPSILETIKLTKTELLLAELTNRIRALGNKEPEHPLMDLKEFLMAKGRLSREPDRSAQPTTAAPVVATEASTTGAPASTTTVAPTTVAATTVTPTTVAPSTVTPTTVAPTTVAPTTVAPTTTATTTMATTTSTKAAEAATIKRDMIVPTLVVAVDGAIEHRPQETPSRIPELQSASHWGTVKKSVIPLDPAMLSVKLEPPNDHSEGDDVRAMKKESDEGKKHKTESDDGRETVEPQPMIFNDPVIAVQVERPVGEAAAPQRNAFTTDVPEPLHLVKESTVTLRSHAEAIEYLKSKIEALEKRLFDRLNVNSTKNHPQDGGNFIASDDEVANIRRQSRVDSQRRIATAEHDNTADVLKNLDDLNSDEEEDSEAPMEPREIPMPRSMRMVRHSPPKALSIVWTDVEREELPLPFSSSRRRRLRRFSRS